jgi:hypothetical protein
MARRVLGAPLECPDLMIHIGDRTTREVTRQVLHSVMDARRAEELMRSHGEELMERGMRRGWERGRAETRAEDVLRILDARGMPVTEEVRQRILTCTDIATLDRWFTRALRARTLAGVLGDVSQERECGSGVSSWRASGPSRR